MNELRPAKVRNLELNVDETEDGKEDPGKTGKDDSAKGSHRKGRGGRGRGSGSAAPP